nr:NEDD8-conjugating enzyme Ubc12-like [Tanacetum cinerariifolium]
MGQACWVLDPGRVWTGLRESDSGWVSIKCTRRSLYLGGKFTFTFQIATIYPHEAPKVKCKERVYHPNIDLDGNVCLNILREDWKPVLSINTVIYGLYHLFT